MPQILAALSERLSTDYQPQKTPPQKPVEELLVELSDPKVETMDGKRRASATAKLVYEPADATAREVESKRFSFTAPLGPIEADDLRWYLEDFYRWPSGVFRERAERVEANLPNWGKLLFDEAAKSDSAKDVLNAWRNAADSAERRFSVQVDSALPDGASAEDQAAANEAASLLLSLPWELLHDGRGFLFHGKNPVRVRRRLPNRNPQPSVTRELPIRILLVSPRPEEKGVTYLDHRISAKPLVEAVESLGELAKLTILTPPTFAALQTELTRAADAGQPYDVVHFDGHGVYDRKIGLGGLCFEDPKDADKLEDRAMQLVYGAVSDAERAQGKLGLAEVMRDHRIPLVFLEACQSAQTEENPSASVAASLLNEGVTSVVAMSHSVLVETARRFVKAFYEELVKGARVGSAMLAGQRALQTDSHRGRIAGAGDLRLQDWFVPVLYQEAQDPRLVPQLPSADAQQLASHRRRLSLGRLPAPPPHTFIGRSRELLTLERLLLPDATPELRYAAVRGVGGEGKTTLAAELARWLVQTNRFRRAAFVSFDPNDERGCGDARSLLDSLGQQLLPEGERWSVAECEWKVAVQEVERALRDHPTILALDNLESLLPMGTTGGTGNTGKDSQAEPGSDETNASNDQESPRDPRVPRGFSDEIFTLCQTLLRAHPATRIVFTSRERLPAPFDHRRREIPLGQLSREDAVELVSQVVRSQNRPLPEAEMPGGTAQAITDLIETANRHARALVRLTQELADRDLRSTTDDLRAVMAALDRRHPGDRENSLYASVELSLRRLPPDLREQAQTLAVFHGGANIAVLGMILEAEVEAVQRLATALIEVGLAEAMPYGHLRLDPALPAFLLRELSENEQEVMQARWVAGMQRMTSFLYAQQIQNARLSAQLTLLELPNLLAMLTRMKDKLTPESLVYFAIRMESLFSKLGRPQAFALARRAREEASKKLDGWGHARFEAERYRIEHLFDLGDLTSAYLAAEELCSQSIQAGEDAYLEAPYDIAHSYWLLGKILNAGRTSEKAIPLLLEAQHRFQILSEMGNTVAERMVYISINYIGHCFRDLGRWDDAAIAYEQSIGYFEKSGDKRSVASAKGNLGIVRTLQERYEEALEIYTEIRIFFESLNELEDVANTCHQIGAIYRKMGQIELAENAYRQSLAIRVQHGDRTGEASTLTELGNLYHSIDRFEDAVKCYRLSAEMRVELDRCAEGLSRSNLADALIKLQQYEEARREVNRALECKRSCGEASKIWTTWTILHNLEQATGNLQAAADARQQAIQSYLAYRRAGGQSLEQSAQRCDLVFQAIQQGETVELEQVLVELTGDDIPIPLRTLIPKLQAILRGDRNLELADDQRLSFDDVVELQLLLERLGAK